MKRKLFGGHRGETAKVAEPVQVSYKPAPAPTLAQKTMASLKGLAWTRNRGPRKMRWLKSAGDLGTSVRSGVKAVAGGMAAKKRARAELASAA